MNKKFFVLLSVLLLTLGISVQASDAGVTILYTNDVHTYIDNHVGEGNENALTYSKVAALKDSLQNVILVDAGDHIQGTAYGDMDDGETIIELMNEAGYDAATLGNHEFDYGMARCLSLMEKADYPYLSCNFRSLETGESVLEHFAILERGGKKIAFVGITTPETLTSSAPVYFQNEHGEYIYHIAGGEDGTELYAAVQRSIDGAKAAGADYVIALGHLGVDPSSSPWTSREVIANTTGLDAFIDGHSHTAIPMEAVTDKNGEEVILTQTGSYLDAVGQLTISPDGSISTKLLHGEELAGLERTEEVRAIEDEWIAELDAQLGTVIGYAEVTLDNFDADGNRLVRRQETNSGDFSADALYYLFDEMGIDVDVAIMNGGGVRNTAITGELTYLSCKEIHTFGNVACLVTISGQQLLDTLEWGVRLLAEDGSAEDGTFFHVSGIRYTVDLSIPSTVQEENGIWTGNPTGAYRVKKVEVLNNQTGSYESLDLSANYNLAGYNYTLRNQGGGCSMFAGAVNVLDYVAEDHMVLANYIQSFPVSEETGLPTITAADGYSSVYGDGRVTFVTEEALPAEEGEVSDYVVAAGDSLWAIAKRCYGMGSKWRVIYEANKERIQNPDLIYIGQTLSLPVR